MKRTILCVALLFSLCGLQPGLCRAQQPAKINRVYLGPSRTWQVGSGKQPWVHLLAREITRQAFLMAARDELGLVTRDAWLGDSISPQGDAVPWDITTTPGSPLILHIVHGSSPEQKPVAHCEIRRSGSIDYGSWATQAELLSRTKFVEALEAGGASRPAE